MTPGRLLEWLVALIPGFGVWWTLPDNLVTESDGSFSHCGVFMELEWFLRDHYELLSPDQNEALGAFVSECVALPDHVPISNAAATCFVENIAGLDCDRAIAPHLTGSARDCWKAWGGRDLKLNASD